MKHLVALFAISLVTTATKAADPAVACGEPTDPCMNNENWALCQVLVEDGCQDIAVMESCPLQFACNDDATAGACVTLNVYEDKYFCTGDPIITLSFPTSTAKGGPCYHDESMPYYSVNDQYCNLKTGNWHETVYFWSEECEAKKWWEFWKPMPSELTFTTDGCIAGFQLRSCTKGPCSEVANAEDAAALMHERMV